ncbi:MAG: sulfatase-like hydrolase/transferase [Bacteroidota bacterium]
MPSILFAQAPNVVFILADDLGYGDLACYGHQVIQTPHLDKLASEGMRMTQFYAPSPLCSPSRAGMLTGRTPFRTGIKSWIPEGQDIYLRAEEITIATLLKEAGYQTFLAGKWHLNGGLGHRDHPQPQEHGFDKWIANHAFSVPNHKNPTDIYRNGAALGRLEGYAAQIAVDSLDKWVENRAPDRPFFAYLALNEPHSEIASPPMFEELYRDWMKGPVSLDTLLDNGPGEYYANISHLDYQIGRVMHMLNRLNLEDNTLVIFSSDNGPVTTEWRQWWEINMYGSAGGLRGRKGDLFEGGIRVPCIIRHPGQIEPGAVSHEPAYGVDLLPTICAWTNISSPTNREIDGINLSPVWKGEELGRKKALFWAFPISGAKDPAGFYYAVREGNWKLITDQKLEKSLLYNLREDPHEVRNLSRKHPHILARLKLAVKQMAGSIEDDPLRPN